MCAPCVRCTSEWACPGRYEVYACTARSLVTNTNTPDAVKDVLRTALASARQLRNPTHQAWILREASNEILGRGGATD